MTVTQPDIAMGDRLHLGFQSGAALPDHARKIQCPLMGLFGHAHAVHLTKEATIGYLCSIGGRVPTTAEQQTDAADEPQSPEVVAADTEPAPRQEDHDEAGADGEEEMAHPKGTLFLMLLYLMLIIALWGYMYLVMIERGS